MFESLGNLVSGSGFFQIFASADGWKALVMILISCVLLYLGIKKQYEPLLMCGIAFGCLLANVSVLGGFENALYHQDLWNAFLDESSEFYHDYGNILAHGGLIDILYIGVKAGIYPCLIFIGIGAMTDFGPLISNPKSLLLGAAAQFGVFFAFFGATLLGFNGNEAASIGIIGGADGPTAILTTTKLAPHLLGPIAVAAYSYMALIPMIQPPLMKMLTTEKERSVKMEQLREVSKTEKILFPIVGAADRLPDVRQPLKGNRLHGQTFGCRSERIDEHRHAVPRHLRRRDHGRLELLKPSDDLHRRPWSHRLCVLDDRRSFGRQAHV